MATFAYTPHGVCSRRIDIELADDNETIERVSFVGGCDGNLKAIGRLVQGHSAQEIAQILQGNRCGQRNTSCADQLAMGLKAAREAAQS